MFCLRITRCTGSLHDCDSLRVVRAPPRVSSPAGAFVVRSFAVTVLTYTFHQVFVPQRTRKFSITTADSRGFEASVSLAYSYSSMPSLIVTVPSAFRRLKVDSSRHHPALILTCCLYFCLARPHRQSSHFRSVVLASNAMFVVLVISE